MWQCAANNHNSPTITPANIHDMRHPMQKNPPRAGRDCDRARRRVDGVMRA